MNIYSGYAQSAPPNQVVNMIGKYLFHHLIGAFKQVRTANSYDVYVTLLYQLPWGMRKPGLGKEYNDVHEMTLDLSITTYQNKIRVNIIECDKNNRVLGYDVFPLELFNNLEKAKTRIFNRVCERITNAYSEYDFLF